MSIVENYVSPVLNNNGKQAKSTDKKVFPALLQLLLFVDQRPSSQEHVQRIRSYLQGLQVDHNFEIQVIDVSDQPYLAEHFRLVATPALIKIFPEPRQTLTGTDLVRQLQKWWPRWQLETNEQQRDGKTRETPVSDGQNCSSPLDNFNYSAELIRLSDEIFRIKQEKEELFEQLKFKDQVLAMLVHDLRSPLTAASIAMETLELAQGQETERSEQLRQQLHRQARNQFRVMERMINDILQAARGKNAELRMNPHKLYLQFLFEEMLKQFAERFDSKSFRVEKDIPQDLPAVYADEELLNQVMINLLDNALKYTPEKGNISLSILHRTAQKIQVSVCNSGPGIPKEKCDRIFEDHFRLERDEKKEGYGLGLSLCRKVIRAHYGHIWVDSSPQQGSCFHFTLPVYDS